MRKLATIMTALGCAFALAACVGQNDQKTDQPAAAETAEQQAPAPQRTVQAARPTTTTPTAPTPAQIAQCVRDGLAADNRTEAQARDLRVDAEVTINGTKQRLAAGQSYWSLCSGPSIEARLTSVTTERNQWRAYAERLELLAMVDPRQGLARENLWTSHWTRADAQNTALNEQLAKAQRDARVYGFLFFIAIIAIIIMGAVWYFTSHPVTPRKRANDLTGVDPRPATTAGTGHTE